MPQRVERPWGFDTRKGEGVALLPSPFSLPAFTVEGSRCFPSHSMSGSFFSCLVLAGPDCVWFIVVYICRHEGKGRKC